MWTKPPAAVETWVGPVDGQELSRKCLWGLPTRSRNESRPPSGESVTTRRRGPIRWGDPPRQPVTRLLGPEPTRRRSGESPTTDQPEGPLRLILPRALRLFRA